MKKHAGKTLLELFWTFLKISPVTFGGGYAMIPLIEREISEKRAWIKSRELPDLLAVAGAAPGAVGINTAMIVGYRIAGLPGAVASLIGIMLPPFLIVLLLAAVIFNAGDNPWVKAAFRGIVPAIVALILYAGYLIGKSAVVDIPTLAVAGLTVAMTLFLSISPIWMIVGGAVASFIWVQGKNALLQRRKTPRLGAKGEPGRNKPSAGSM